MSIVLGTIGKQLIFYGQILTLSLFSFCFLCEVTLIPSGLWMGSRGTWVLRPWAPLPRSVHVCEPVWLCVDVHVHMCT